MKPFDIDAAKRGETIEYDFLGEFLGESHTVYFVGETKEGRIAFQRIGDDFVHVREKSLLRMAPKPPREMWVQLYRNVHGEIFCTQPKFNKEDALRCVQPDYTLFLVDAPQKVFVEDES